MRFLGNLLLYLRKLVIDHMNISVLLKENNINILLNSFFHDQLDFALIIIELSRTWDQQFLEAKWQPSVQVLILGLDKYDNPATFCYFFATFFLHKFFSILLLSVAFLLFAIFLQVSHQSQRHHFKVRVTALSGRTLANFSLDLTLGLILFDTESSVHVS